MELLIWAGGRWRRVCLKTGRVAGWRRRVRIACNRRGVLRELAPSVLGSVIKGPALPRIRKRKRKSGNLSKSFQLAIQTVRAKKDACIQTDTESVQITAVSNTLHSSKTQTTPQKASITQDDKENQVTNREKESVRSANTDISELRANNEQKSKTINVHEKSKEDNRKEDSTVVNKTSNNGTQKSVKHKNESVASSENHFKELIIDEEDVILLRHYIETHDTSIDLYKFDIDDNYKTLVFYKINPLVMVERCARIAQMLKERDVHVTVHFARQLGLRSVDDSDEADSNRKRRKHRAAKQAAMTRSTADSESGVEKSKVYKKKEITSVDSDNDLGILKKRKKTQKILSVEEDSDQENSVILRNRSKKVTRSTEDVNNKENVRKLMRKTTKDTTGDKESRTVEKRTQNTNESDNNDDQTKHKSKNVKEIPSESSDEETFETSKLRDNLQRKATTTARSNETDQNVRNKPAFDTKLSKGCNDGENRQRKDKKTLLEQRSVKIPKRSSVRPGREYSTLEDQAIVAWISTSTQRERAVNGNRVWKELQTGYTSLTGQTRSWHSLRNRYLRYILPALGALALPPAHAQRLRAHATLGELKARKKNRENSAFRLPVVRSAFARAPRPPRAPTPHDETIPKRSSSLDTSESGTSESDAPTRRLRSNSCYAKSPAETSESDSPKRRVLRSSSCHTNSSAKPRPRRNQSPNKSDTHTQSPSKTNSRRQSTSSRTQSLNKRKHRSRSRTKAKRRQSPIKRTQSSNKATNSRQSPKKRTQSSNKATDSTQSPSKKSSPRSSPTYSELTRRFALRNRSTPHSSPTQAVVHNKRRLYNPQRLSSNSSPVT